MMKTVAAHKRCSPPVYALYRLRQALRSSTILPAAAGIVGLAFWGMVLSVGCSWASEATELFNEAVFLTDPEEQVVLYKKVLALEPDLDMVQHNLGAAYYRLGMFEQSIDSLKMALKANPRYSHSHYLLACCYARLDLESEALASVKKAVRCGWREGLMLKEDTDLDSIRSERGFPRLRGTGEKSRVSTRSTGTRRRLHRRRSKLEASAVATPPAASPSEPPPTAPRVPSGKTKGK